MHYDIEHLFGSHRLAVLTQMKTLTVYHVSDLLRAHSPTGGCETIDYGFFNFHFPNVTIFLR